MAKIKTARTDKDVDEYIASIPDERKRDDSYELIRIMSELTGEEPYMYGPTIIGFGNYHYKYASGHEGDAPIAGFAPRKAALTLYVMEFPGRSDMLGKLGKHKASVACIYVKKLDDIDTGVLKKMIKASIAETRRQYPG